MANLFTESGRNKMLDQMVGHVNAPINAIGVSNLSAITAGADSIASATFSQVNAINATSPASGQETTISANFTSAQISGNNIVTITAHNDGAGVDTGVIAGQDGQSLTYNDVDVTIQVTLGLATA